MKLNRLQLKVNAPTKFVEDIDFSNHEFDPLFLRGIKECHAEAEATEYEELLRVEVHVKTKVIAVCAYTLDDVELELDINEELSFSDQKDDEYSYYEDGAIIDLDEYILSLIISYIPPKVIKKGAKPPKGGDGYRVLSEDDLAKERANKVDPRWSALDDLDLE